MPYIFYRFYKQSSEKIKNGTGPDFTIAVNPFFTNLILFNIIMISNMEIFRKGVVLIWKKRFLEPKRACRY